MTIPQAFALALQRHRAGRLADAEALYRQILAAQPRHADTLHLLSVIAHQTGRHDLAVDLIRQAIAINPNNPATQCFLGEACHALGDFDEAIAAHARAIALKPDFPEAHIHLGAALSDRGRLDEAVAAYRRAIALRPDFPEAHNNLGNALRGQRRVEEAIAAYLRAIALRPDYAGAHNNLGSALREQGRLDEAVTACRRAIELQPDFAPAFNNLGNARRERGQLDEAIAAYDRAIELQPGYPEAHVNLGAALSDRGQINEAVAAYRRALQMRPDDANAHSGLIFTLHCAPAHDGLAIAEEHRRWNLQFGDPLKGSLSLHANARDPDRKLRIGYVSPDLRDHPVGRYLLPLLERHDRERFDVLCYSGAAQPDSITERLRALTRTSDTHGGWRDTAGVSDARLAGMIREDAVDILVDLAMHTAGNRLPVFARRPAPVQVSWLAYPGGAGLPSISYRLTDSHMDPPGDRPVWFAEEPVRLPGCWCCYQPIGDSPEINALPALSATAVTFGSLNNFAKVNDGVLALWARVLAAVKGSRLVMLCPDGQARETIRAFFGAREITPERLELVANSPRWEYLERYQRIDIALDPFPFNGMTTTCDALWMGVPVLTLPGEMPTSRAGLSLLSSVGLAEFAASSEDDYARMALELAANLPRLADLRTTLRARTQASPLMDAPRFARNVEAAYRFMSQAWCNKQPSVRR